MKFYVLTSESLHAISTAVTAKKWAVSKRFADTPSLVSRAEKLPIGVTGLFYCKLTKSFTVPFVVRSQPNRNSERSDIWDANCPEIGGYLPFQIFPNGTINRQFHKDRVSVLPRFPNGRQWYRVLPVLPARVFTSIEIADETWNAIMKELAD